MNFGTPDSARKHLAMFYKRRPLNVSNPILLWCICCRKLLLRYCLQPVCGLDIPVRCTHPRDPSQDFEVNAQMKSTRLGCR